MAVYSYGTSCIQSLNVRRHVQILAHRLVVLVFPFVLIGDARSQVVAVYEPKWTDNHQSLKRVAFSPDGKRLIAFGDDHVFQWQLDDGSQVVTPLGNDCFLAPLSISFWGDKVQFVDSRGDRIFRVLPGRDPPFEFFELQENRGRKFVASPDGKLLAVLMDGDRDLSIIQTESRSVATKVRLPRDLQHISIAFSPNNKLLAIGSHASTNALMLVDVATGEMVRSSGGFASGAKGIAISPNSEHIATLSTFNDSFGVVIWTTSPLRPVSRAHFTRRQLGADPKNNCVFSPNGKLLAVPTKDNAIQLIDLQSGRPLTALRGYDLDFFAFSPNGQHIASIDDYDGSKVVLWNWKDTLRFIKPSRSIRTHQRGARTSRIAYSPKGDLIAITAATYPAGRDFNGTEKVILDAKNDEAAYRYGDPAIILIVNTASRRVWRKLVTKADQYDRFLHIQFSPKGRLLAGLFDENVGPTSTVVWDLAAKTPKVNTWIENAAGDPEAMTFSSDGRFFAVALRDSLRVFDIKNKWRKHEFTGDFARSVHFSPDGKYIASGLSIWDADVGTRLMTSSEVDSDDFTKVLFSNDGRRLYGIDHHQPNNPIIVWELDNATASFPFSFHRGATPIETLDIALSPSGMILAAASNDRRIRLWATTTHELLATLVGHQAQVDSVAFSPDGKTLASSSSDGTTRFWNISSLSHKPSKAPEPASVIALPTRREFKVSGGVSFTVTSDRPLTKSELVKASKELTQILKQSEN